MAEFCKAGALIQQETRPDNCAAHGTYTANGYAFNGKIRWMACPECARQQQAEQAVRQAEQDTQAKQHHIEQQLHRAGIPLRYRSKDFAAYLADTDGKIKARAVAMEFADNFAEHTRRGTVMVFSGMPGTGKSHLAIAIARQVMQSGTALYSSAIDVVRMVRDTWRRDSAQTERQVLHMLATIDLLILDEVGVQYGTEAEQVTLFDVIDKRYRDLMPTILLTNLNKTGMKTFLGDRSFDRLREGGIWVTFDWLSQRSSMPQ